MSREEEALEAAAALRDAEDAESSGDEATKALATSIRSKKKMLIAKHRREKVRRAAPCAAVLACA